MKVERKNLGKMLGYVVDIAPNMRWGKFLYTIKLAVMDLPNVVTQNMEELLDWIWYGSAVNVEISSVQQEDKVKLVVDNVSPNEYESSIQPVPVNVLNFDAQTGELVLKRDDGRMLTLRVYEEHVRDELLATSEKNFYALFLEKPIGLRIIGLIRSSKYKLFSRAKELANSFIPSFLEHNLCKM
ncbi:MAG: hypothetical protein LZ170_04555 [Thaumarchaeota archaeon]|nr:hypothetical protein [Candidatus Terraquivivens yellowstonensis]MCL7399483.1 hypothetical protein [Candidatus Terraquivivens yellowstonensis]